VAANLLTLSDFLQSPSDRAWRFAVHALETSHETSQSRTINIFACEFLGRKIRDGLRPDPGAIDNYVNHRDLLDNRNRFDSSDSAVPLSTQFEKAALPTRRAGKFCQFRGKLPV
jgi:hypothetical protein